MTASTARERTSCSSKSLACAVKLASSPAAAERIPIVTRFFIDKVLPAMGLEFHSGPKQWAMLQDIVGEVPVLVVYLHRSIPGECVISVVESVSDATVFFLSPSNQP